MKQKSSHKLNLNKITIQDINAKLSNLGGDELKMVKGGEYRPDTGVTCLIVYC